MKKTIVINQRVTPSAECGCGHVAEDQAHKHESSAGGGCCSDASDAPDHVHPAHGHEEGCCGGLHAPKTEHDGDRPSIADKGPHP